MYRRACLVAALTALWSGPVCGLEIVADALVPASPDVTDTLDWMRLTESGPAPLRAPLDEITTVELFITDDSPEDDGGGALYDAALYILDRDGVEHAASDVGLRRLYGGGRQVTIVEDTVVVESYLQATALIAETVFVTYELRPPGYTGPDAADIEAVVVSLTVAGDYRIQLYVGEVLVGVVQAEGNVGDLSNRSVVRLELRHGPLQPPETIAAPTTPTISTIAGTGLEGYGGDGGSATQAALALPLDVFGDAAGNLYVADWANHRVRRIDPEGTITTVAGTGSAGYGGDGGPASEAALRWPAGVFVDGSGSLFIADSGNSRIRRVDPNGTITTVAGSDRAGFTGDGGPATEARLDWPMGMFVDDGGNLLIADWRNNRVRRVDAVGTITTVAGNGDFFDSGDGLSATEAGLSSPFGLFVDAEGNLLVSSWEWSRIRRIEAGTGIISTVVDFSTTKDLFGDAAGRLFVGDAGNNVVRALETDGANTITVGSGAWGFGGDGGPAPFARLNAPVGVFVDARGSLFIADHHNHRIRRVDGLAAPTPPRAGVFQAAAMTAVPLETASTPEQTRLLDGYPNPFNAGTTLRYRLASATDVRLQLYDVAGRHVRTLVRRYRPAGNHQVAGTAPTTTAVPWPAVSTWRACRRWARSTWASCFCSSECPSVSPWGPVGSVAVARASKGHSRTSRSSPSRRDLGRRVVPA